MARMAHKKPTRNKPRKYKIRIKRPLLKRLPGTARRYRILKTGKIISDRQRKRIFGEQSIKQKLGKKRGGLFIEKHKAALSRYERLVEDFRHKRERDGFFLSKRGARNSSQLKKIVRDLKSKNPERQSRALYESGRISMSDIERYKHIFMEESGKLGARHIYYVVSKLSGRKVFEGTYRECSRYLNAFPRRKKNFKIIKGELLTEEEGEE